jgi:hypothetical protein
MKHLATIQAEFLKVAIESINWWDKLTMSEQQQYISEHPGTHLKVKSDPLAKEKKLQHEILQRYENRIRDAEHELNKKGILPSHKKELEEIIERTKEKYQGELY